MNVGPAKRPSPQSWPDAFWRVGAIIRYVLATVTRRYRCTLAGLAGIVQRRAISKDVLICPRIGAFSVLYHCWKLKALPRQHSR